MEAATGFEPVIKVLQTFALPLGYAASFLHLKQPFSRYKGRPLRLPFLLERKTGLEPATLTLAR